MINNTHHSYGWITILLHWLSVITIIGLFSVGIWMVDLDYYSEWYREAPHLHKSTGILFGIVIVFRMLWAFKQPKPNPQGSKVEVKLSGFAHKLLYLLMLSLIVSGYLISTADSRDIDVFNWFSVPGMGSFVENQEDIAGEIHEIVAFSLIGFAILHALAALKHHFINRDKTLSRMLKPTRHLND